ncbi:MAG: efflux RND transporter permease subunit [Phycisphaerales bacterium]|nr:efflux RND transporter permease subunit [Phycisphaerales bacterium]
MWIVLFALRYKYTVGVLGILILLFGVLSVRRMSTDILPRVDSPELLLVWTYNGLDASEMASKITSFSEIATLNNLDDVAEVRSETSNGSAIVRIRFQPGVNIATAQAQAVSVSQTIIRRMPQGTTPPLIVRTSPSSVPIIQLVISSDTMSGGQLFDYARLQLRSQLQSIPGMRISLPYGGAARQVMVDLDPLALNAFGLSSAEVNAALVRQNLTLPSGSILEGGREMPIELNASPERIEEFLDLPIRSVGGETILLRDVANVRDGEAVSTNIARLNGQNAVIIAILKLGNASTVEIIDSILERMPEIRASAPPGMLIEPIFDQSVFVRAAVAGIEHEILLVGGLVAFVVLFFLGSWRSTIIVLTSIPLALLCSVIGLLLAGATFNLMTLGGLALSIGILVDNALVEIENTKRQIASGKDVLTAIKDGAQQVAFPEFVSTLSICIVFLPIFLLTGTSAYVFQPLALAVIFAMIASYCLARTLVPTLASMILPSEVRAEAKAAGRPPRGLRWMHLKMEHAIDGLSGLQGRILGLLLRWKVVILIPIGAAVALGVFSALHAGREFFPKTDAGLIRLFVRVPSGSRVEDTAQVLADVQRNIREIIPASELRFVVENIGAPSPINQAWVQTTSSTSSDAEVLVQLAKGHAPSLGYEGRIRAMMAEKFPDVEMFFRPADTTSQTLSSGAPTTFEIRFVGRDRDGNLVLARDLMDRMEKIPGVADVTLREVLDQPRYSIRIDRARAATFGINQQDASSSILAALGSGGTVAPNVWADPIVGTSYDVQVIAPPSTLTSVEQLLNLPIRPSNGAAPVPLRSFATLTERRSPASISRTTLQPTITVVANAVTRDIGSVSDRLNKIIDELRTKQRPANRIELTGQAALMRSAYSELIGGLGLAAVLVFLVMVVNFQSWLLPLVAISGLPVAISGAVFSLWLFSTPISVPALMGIILVVGVSTANSVLVGSFARDLFVGGMPARAAAIEAATTRLRPVLMTATAMILGVVPMALGGAEGGEQNAPLGRAVIGGLFFGTIASLFVVPVAFDFVCSRFRRPMDVPPGGLASEAVSHPPVHSSVDVSSNGHAALPHGRPAPV